MSASDRRAAGSDLWARAASIPKTMALAWEAGRGWTAAWLCVVVLQGLVPLAMVHVVRAVVDALAAAVDGGLPQVEVGRLLGLAALAGGLVLATEGLRAVADWVRTVAGELLQDHVNDLIHRRSTTVDMAFYESSDFHDRLHRARDEGRGRPQALLEGTGALVQSLVTGVSMAVVLAGYGLWLPPLLLVSTAPALVAVLRHTRRRQRWWHATTADRRRAQYYDILLTQPFAAAEIRLFGLADHFRTGYRQLRGRLRSEQADLARRQAWLRLAAGAWGLAMAGCALGWMVWRAVQGAASLGDLALFQQAFQRGQGMIHTGVASLSQVQESSFHLQYLEEFLALEPRVTTPDDAVPVPAAPRRGIDFEGVSFRYPGGTRDVLSGFDLHIPAGRKVAIVGANGAGKSTLIKLLCRFFDPTQGRVAIDGVDLRRMDLESLRRQVTVLFQQPVLYQDTARQNIALGALDDAGMERVAAAAQAAGADGFVRTLPDGYDTQLGRWFADGVELSGGQWQRVALARAFLRQAPIIVLDEPTSAMDTWSEQAWLDRFDELARGRTVMMVTHRFTTAMRADLIYVVDAGGVVESGTHEQLLERAGAYAASWWQQAGVGAEERVEAPPPAPAAVG